MADKYYDKSLSLMQLLHKIYLESVVDFSREQAELLGSFLGHLIMLQQEQRVIAYGFSEHLEQLRKRDEAATPAFSSNSVDDDGDRIKCPLILSKHTMDSYIWRQKHQFDSLYIILREST
ncbi:midasin-like [Papaver somniferum]|uniref:midasin-like n=1 Tax=Papaver somniferum TaxID=3469 RepID=UPI000E6F6691|nr:midasin-like [Papaver somniferum]